ncbi:hypothetical protein SEUCBS140593_002200 [Sporothrix eucalyptigena]|uniref:Multicopper oxidase n=1 Tax=Sporothrix eucalyptigena TaxID=1812306 RepID=A0ABP0B4P8_9PEZI
MILICNLAVMILTGLTYYRWSQHSQIFRITQGSTASHTAAPAISAPGTTGIPVAAPSAGPIAVTTSTPVPVQTVLNIPPSKNFDLKQTGFSATGTPQRHDYIFNITRQISNSDGFDKPMILVNGQSPGPLIEANVGDTIRVVVYNSMSSDSTTVHWHGIDQRNSAWMDGLYGVTQCGIPPGEKFTYEFTAQGQRGSFWYHSHVTGQYTDGLYGPLIIHDPEEMVPKVDEDWVVMAGDLYHRTEKELLDEYLGKGRRRAMVGMEPTPDNFVMNGRNVLGCAGQPRAKKLPGSDEYTLAQCASGSVFSMVLGRGKSARLRLISHSSNIPLWFSVDGHVLQIVEIDGVEVEPIKTTRVFLNPGQRYSVVLHADQPAGNYMIRASAARRCSMVHFGSKLDSINYEAAGILSYNGVDATDPFAGEPWQLDSLSHPDFGNEPWAGRTCEDMPFDLAKPRRAANAFNIGEGNQHHISFEMKQDGNALRTFIGGSVFTPLNDNALLWKAAEQGSPDKSDPVFPDWHFHRSQHVFVSHEPGKPAQIAISAMNMMTHPWHLQYVSSSWYEILKAVTAV